jgi:hypothetical protein
MISGSYKAPYTQERLSVHKEGKLLEWKYHRSDNWPLYKRFQLVYFNLKSTKDQAWCPKHVGECLATEPYLQSSGEKKHFSLATTLSCLSTENISTERQVIKASKQ